MHSYRFLYFPNQVEIILFSSVNLYRSKYLPLQIKRKDSHQCLPFDEPHSQPVGLKVLLTAKRETACHTQVHCTSS